MSEARCGFPIICCNFAGQYDFYDIPRGRFIISVKAQAKKFEMDLYLSRRSIAVAM